MGYDKNNQEWKSRNAENHQGVLTNEEIVGWADRYINDWAQVMDLLHVIVAQPPGQPMTFGDQADIVYKLLSESLCGDLSHYTGSCTCDAKLDIKAMFLCNPASALRTATVGDLWGTWTKSNPIPKQVVQYAAAKLREIQYDRYEMFDFLRYERGLQPLLSNDEMLHSQALVAETLREAFNSQGQALGEELGGADDGIPQAVDRMLRRYQVVKVMASMMLEDVGISSERLQLAVSRMARIAREPKNRRWNKTVPLERLAWRVGEEEGNPDVTGKIIGVVGEKSSWLQDQKTQWWENLRRYQEVRTVFAEVTEEISRDEWESLREEGEVTECDICGNGFFEAPATGDGSLAWAESNFFSVLNRYEGGEGLVMITGCGHIFGERCLFQNWARTDVKQNWSCPACYSVIYKSREREASRE